MCGWVLFGAYMFESMRRVQVLLRSREAAAMVMVPGARHTFYKHKLQV